MTNEDNPGVRAQVITDVGYLTFARPERRNALRLADWASVPPLVTALQADGARVLVLRGADQIFCAGADISEFATARAAGRPAAEYEAANERAFAAVRDAAVPTLAAIEGFCIGGGFGLAAACDLRLTTAQATFAIPAGRLGLAYPVDAMADVVGAIGAGAAKRMFMTAKRFDAQTLADWGFAQVVEDMDVELEKALHQIRALAPMSLQAAKLAIDGVRLNAPGRTKAARLLGERTFASADYAEGLRAFAARESPNFTGS